MPLPSSSSPPSRSSPAAMPCWPRRSPGCSSRRSPDPSAVPGLDRLTEREVEVLRLMARGMSNSEIADHLYLGEATVKTHVGRVLGKLDARDRVQAVVAAYESGLVEPGTR